jgi:hypothetical protein
LTQVTYPHIKAQSTPAVSGLRFKLVPLYFASKIISIVKKHEMNDLLQQAILPSNSQIRWMGRMDDPTAALARQFVAISCEFPAARV